MERQTLHDRFWSKVTVARRFGVKSSDVYNWIRWLGRSSEIDPMLLEACRQVAASRWKKNV